MATTNDLAHATGRTGTLVTGDGNLKVRVRILDSRVAYGRIQYQVTPTDGAGEKWVDEARVYDVRGAAS
jgi:hypothetical protein